MQLQFFLDRYIIHSIHMDLGTRARRQEVELDLKMETNMAYLSLALLETVLALTFRAEAQNKKTAMA